MFSINTSSNPVNLFYVLPLRSSLRPSLYSKSTIDILWEINSSFVSLVYIRSRIIRIIETRPMDFVFGSSLVIMVHYPIVD